MGAPYVAARSSARAARRPSWEARAPRAPATRRDGQEEEEEDDLDRHGAAEVGVRCRIGPVI